MIVSDLKPPYYAVIFTSLLTDNLTDYESTAERMEALAKEQEGYLGIEYTRNELGITISYWKDLDAVAQWKNNVEHTEARNRGREQWYKQYQLRICKVEREYGFQK
ncbi:antibiotic biosynthesis monooxygenase [Pseudotenacibaculum sp. MALMAid0570]|mgnify:CR=1 FL=1|uniref:antibiotic biosynthesis monooxygenase family protein n=1 Tax=Pseudotenacibaculum sp. MALMAid0570 TaxID=3143938 RepID=UPI0032DFD604